MTSCSTYLADSSFSQVVIDLANSPSPETFLAQRQTSEYALTEKCLETLSQAYSQEDLDARFEVQYALFTLNNLSLAKPESAAALNQYNPLLLALKIAIQKSWLAYEYTRFPEINPESDQSLLLQLTSLCHSHRASQHSLFDFLESSATICNLDYFFKSDSALNILFFDLVALMLPGSHPQTRAEICKNLWDESGNGNPERTHVGLYQYLLTQRKILLPENNFTDLYSWEGYTGYNVFMLGATNRQYYYNSIGAMAMTELLDPPQYTKLVKGINRLGINENHALYYTEHIDVDVLHADGWLNNVIAPLVQDKPEALEGIFAGAMLRLQSCADYYDSVLTKMKS